LEFCQVWSNYRNAGAKQPFTAVAQLFAPKLPALSLPRRPACCSAPTALRLRTYLRYIEASRGPNLGDHSALDTRAVGQNAIGDKATVSVTRSQRAAGWRRRCQERCEYPGRFRSAPVAHAAAILARLCGLRSIDAVEPDARAVDFDAQCASSRCHSSPQQSRARRSGRQR
jgi:hypothetical protein